LEAENNRFSQLVTVFQDIIAPEEGYLAGYAALISTYHLQVPLPEMLSLISLKHKQYVTEGWQVFTPRHQPASRLHDHLTFALKYEGIDLLLLKKLFEQPIDKELENWMKAEPLGQYARKIWFLYEWLTGKTLDLPDLNKGNYIDLVDNTLQLSSSIYETVKRQRIRNNLMGVKEFCPMVRRTPTIKKFLQHDFSAQIKDYSGRLHPDIMARAAAFLLLKDSKASYIIEGENPTQNRAQRWGRAIGQAGQHAITRDELIRLQHIVIDNPRFLKPGFRTQEGFIGEHDRRDGTPIPDHISARHKDVQALIDGWLQILNRLENDEKFDAVAAAAMVAFGFVFIHPFEDGNGRIHRYLIHHVLTKKGSVPAGFIFPVSAIMLQEINVYRKVLESFSKPRLDLIEWKPDMYNNVEILNETIDLYRYFDATRQVEFLYQCVQQTLEKTIPEEVDYLEKYDRMKTWLDNVFEMPDSMVALLIRFLAQGNGTLSKRAREKEFSALLLEEVVAIEEKYREVFG
jgi:Fic family protein